LQYYCQILRHQPSGSVQSTMYQDIFPIEA
jgi:hypothetical protein